MKHNYVHVKGITEIQTSLITRGQSSCFTDDVYGVNTPFSRFFKTYIGHQDNTHS